MDLKGANRPINTVHSRTNMGANDVRFFIPTTSTPPMMHPPWFSSHQVALAALLLLSALGIPISTAFGAELVECRRIWDAAPHNAFTDLARWKQRWWCVFREGQGHVSPDGAIRLLVSEDGTEWKPVRRFASERADMRDSKLSVTPSGQLMVIAAAAVHGAKDSKKPSAWENYAWFSGNGSDWSAPQPVGETNVWLWRLTWSGAQGLAIGYDTLAENFVRLYRTKDGKRFDVVVDSLLHEQSPNEHGMVFLGDGTAQCLMRRDGKPGLGLFGVSSPPYRDWNWKEVGAKIGGPALIRLPDERLIAVVRLYDAKVRTSVCALDASTGTLSEMLALPSGGDCSYAGLVWHEEKLWISYYSSHEAKTSIYLAKVRL